MNSKPKTKKLRVKISKDNPIHVKHVVTSNSIKKVINKGTGAGGSKTNDNGLNYEDITSLKSELEYVRHNIGNFTLTSQGDEIYFKDYPDIKILRFTQTYFLKYYKRKKVVDCTIPELHGTKNPDECFVDEEKKQIVIIEKKFQQCGGSVCEKLQTCLFKKENYNDRFPDYEVEYVYCLSDWFKKNCKAELGFCKKYGIPYFWGSDKDYKTKIIKFILKLDE